MKRIDYNHISLFVIPQTAMPLIFWVIVFLFFLVVPQSIPIIQGEICFTKEFFFRDEIEHCTTTVTTHNYIRTQNVHFFFKENLIAHQRFTQFIGRTIFTSRQFLCFNKRKRLSVPNLLNTAFFHFGINCSIRNSVFRFTLK